MSQHQETQASGVLGILGYACLILLAETVRALGFPLYALWIHMGIVLLLIVHYGRLAGRLSPEGRMLPALALVSLYRVAILGMPVDLVPVELHVFLVSIPVLVAALITLRVLDLSRHPAGPAWRSVWRQGFAMLTGIPLVYVATQVLTPSPYTDLLPVVGAEWLDPLTLVGLVSLLVVASATDELVFRGIVQRTAEPLLGPGAILVGAILFASIYAGLFPSDYTLFFVVMGCLLGSCTYGTRSLFGVTVAHGLVNLALYSTVLMNLSW